MSENEWWFEYRYGSLMEKAIGESCFPITVSEEEFLKAHIEFIGKISKED